MMKRSFPVRFALWLAHLSGHTWVFYAMCLWMGAWMVLATCNVWLFARDRYPFAFLLFLSNIIQLVYLPLLQIQAVENHRLHKEHMNLQNLNHTEVTDLLARLHAKIDGKE